MLVERNLTEFARSTIQDVLATAEATDSTAPDSFTQRMIEHLVDAGEITDGAVAYHQARGIEVSGYGIDSEANRINLFITHFRQDQVLASVSKTDLDALVRRLSTFTRRCIEGYSSKIEDASPAFDMVLELEKALKGNPRIRFYVLTNGISKLRSVPAELCEGREAEVHVWDIERLNRLLTSGTLHEPIVVDFIERFGEPLACLTTPETNKDYSVLMAIVPGVMLDSLYEEYGTRLLELNVRSFLQTKGAVNRGIRETIMKNPDRFLAYNNGISATASRVDIEGDPGCPQSIVRLYDLQIVNGGQTTASIHSTSRRDKADLGRVFVQAKITVVTPAQISSIVPNISKYSNTQNKVTTADFSSNDAFHVNNEKMSRSVWAPSPMGDGQETHWFYERARGQYADELARQRTPARQKAWKLNNPTRQKYTKTDLAKFENTYSMLPYLVSRGAEKNFREFMISLGQMNVRPVVDEVAFRRSIAKAILFKRTEKIVTNQNFGGYRANIVTYTIAKLVSCTEGRIDLDEIWKAQDISPALTEALTDLSYPVHASLTSPPAGANIGEWCKKIAAWTSVEALPWMVPAALAQELLDRKVLRSQQLETSERSETAAVGPAIRRASSVPAETWLEVGAWAKENDKLEPFQRGLAMTLGKRANLGFAPSAKQAEQGIQLLLCAIDDGFSATREISSFELLGEAP